MKQMVFWNSLAFSMIQMLFANWSLVLLSFLNSPPFGSSWFTYCCKAHLKDFEHDLASMWNECNCGLIIWSSNCSLRDSLKGSEKISMWRLQYDAIEVLLKIAKTKQKTEKQSKCPSTSEWIHNGGIPDNYPAINSNELLLWRVTPQRGWLKKSLSWLKENSRKWNITVTESRSVVSWGRRGDWRGDYKGALVNFQGWWIYSLSWLWSWCYRCKHISKLIKRYFKYMQVSWTVCALSHIQHFAPPQTVAHQASLSMGFSRQNTGVGCHSLLQGIFPTQGSNLGFLHYRQILYYLSHQLKSCV